MDNSIVDFSFIYEMAENDTVYAYEVISLFLTTVSTGLEKLDDLVSNTDDFDAIRHQSHFLKSSANVIKVKGMRDDLYRMESLAREGTGKEEIAALLKEILFNFKEARPVIEAEIAKNKPVNKKKS